MLKTLMPGVCLHKNCSQGWRQNGVWGAEDHVTDNERKERKEEVMADKEVGGGILAVAPPPPSSNDSNKSL